MQTRLAIVIAATAICAVVCANELWLLATAMLTDAPRKAVFEGAIEEVIQEHREAMETYKRRFNGRSLFFLPRPPVIVRSSNQGGETGAGVRGETGESVDQRIYTGPKPIAIVGDEVWFRLGSGPQPLLRIKRGDQAAGVEVIDVKAPLWIKLRHKGWVHKLHLFRPMPPEVFELHPSLRTPTGELVRRPRPVCLGDRVASGAGVETLDFAAPLAGGCRMSS